MRYLDLKFNSLGDEGGRALGGALKNNNSLTYIDVSQNHIPARAWFVVADGLEENTSVKTLVMKGNPCGQEGCRALLRSLESLVRNTFTLYARGVLALQRVVSCVRHVECVILFWQQF